MQKQQRVYQSRQKLLIDNFLGGIAWGLGLTVGLSLVLTILGFIISQIDFIPVFGKLFSEIFNYAYSINPKLR